MEKIRDIAIIGAGNMGGAIAGGLLRNSDCLLHIANRGAAKLDLFEKNHHEYSERYKLSQDFAASVENADLVIIAVKPWAFDEVMASIRLHLKTGCVLLSVAAGCGIEKIRQATDRTDIGRMYMIPNTPIRIGKGMSFAAAADIDESTLEAIITLFSPITQIEIIDENKMPAAMALCSCGVAYVYKFIAAAAQAGVELGFSFDDAVKYFTSTVAGAAAMVENSGKSPQELINEVTTPGGITIKGINCLEREGFPASVIAAILRASKA